MSERVLSTLVDGGSYFEAPRWHDGRWWVFDFYRHSVLAVTTSGKEEVVATVDQQPSGLGWLPDGSMLIVSMKDHRLLHLDRDGSLDQVADLSQWCGGPLNDLVVDPQGRAYVGNFGFDLMSGADPSLASLVRVDPDGTAVAVVDGLFFPNGSVITPDGATLIVGETFGCRYTAFTIDADGTLTDRRVWAQLVPTPPLGSLADTLAAVTLAPDGCSLDEEGSHLGR